MRKKRHPPSLPTYHHPRSALAGSFVLSASLRSCFVCFLLVFMFASFYQVAKSLSFSVREENIPVSGPWYRVYTRFSTMSGTRATAGIGGVLNFLRLHT